MAAFTVLLPQTDAIYNLSKHFLGIVKCFKMDKRISKIFKLVDPPPAAIPLDQINAKKSGSMRHVLAYISTTRSAISARASRYEDSLQALNIQ